MKMVDIDYHVSLYNTANEVPDNIAKLHFPQRYFPSFALSILIGVREK